MAFVKKPPIPEFTIVGLRDLIEEGYEVPEIARYYNTTESSVKRKIESMDNNIPCNRDSFGLKRFADNIELRQHVLDETERHKVCERLRGLNFTNLTYEKAIEILKILRG